MPPCGNNVRCAVALSTRVGVIALTACLVACMQCEAERGRRATGVSEADGGWFRSDESETNTPLRRAEVVARAKAAALGIHVDPKMARCVGPLNLERFSRIDAEMATLPAVQTALEGHDFYFVYYPSSVGETNAAGGDFYFFVDVSLTSVLLWFEGL